MTLREAYDRMTDHDKETVWYLVNDSILWRGWDNLPTTLPTHSKKSHATNNALALATLFRQNGCEREEYT